MHYETEVPCGDLNVLWKRLISRSMHKHRCNVSPPNAACKQELNLRREELNAKSEQLEAKAALVTIEKA